MSRASIIAIVVVAVIVIILIALAGIDTQVPPHRITAPVALPTGNAAAPQP